MPKTLLLADDSVVIQKLVGLSFANEDVDIVTADNGDDAIERARECRPDVVIADVIMPGKSGYEVCEAIKGDDALRATPVLLLKGTFEAFDEGRANEVGADGHITKPFEAQALVEQVHALLARPAASPPPLPATDEPSASAEVAGQANPDDSFDFFDDDVSDLSRSAELPSTSAETDPLAASDPFAVPTDAGPAPEELPPLDELDFGQIGSDNTVALMPESDLAASVPDGLVDLDAGLEAGAEDVAPQDAMTMLADDLFDARDPSEAGPPGRLRDVYGATPTGEAAAPHDPAATSAGTGASEGGAETVVADFDDVRASGSAFADGVDPAETVLADDVFGGAADANSEALEAAAVPTDLDEAFESGVDASGAAQAREARVSVDPADSIFDLSSSDLGSVDPASPGSDVSATVDVAVATGALPDRGSLSFGDKEIAIGAAVVASSGAAAPDTSGPADAPGAGIEAVATLESTSDPSQSFVSAPLLEADPFDGPSEHGVVGGSPSAPFAETDTPAPKARPDLDISPVLRERLHETLEKVAWEAFSELSEQVVQQVLQRVETIAWEVIPQMTEAMIREEIRRMKGEGETDA